MRSVTTLARYLMVVSSEREVGQFLRYISRKRYQELLPRILSAALRLEREMRNTTKVRLRIPSGEDAKRIMKSVKKTYKEQIDRNQVHVEIDDTLIRGFVLHGNGRAVDMSAKRFLYDLYCKLSV